MTNLKHK
jgi:hypothetical protein